MELTILTSKVVFWVKEKCYNQAMGCINNANVLPDQTTQLLEGIILVLSKSFKKGIHKLEELIDRGEVGLAVTCGLIIAHKSMTNKDKNTIDILEVKFKNDRKSGSARSYYYTGLFQYLAGKLEKSKEYVEKALKSDSQDIDLLMLKIWIEIDSNKKEEARKYLDQLNNLNVELPCILLLKSNLASSLDESLDLINESIVRYNDYLPSFIEKIKFYIRNKDYDAAVDTCYRTLQENNYCLQAQHFIIIYHLVVEVDYNEAEKKIKDLRVSLETIEKNNSYLCYFYSSIFSQLCDKNKQILNETIKLQNKALENLDTEEAVNLKDKCIYLDELARQFFLLGNDEESFNCFNVSVEADKTNLSPLLGRLKYLIMKNKNNQDHFQCLLDLEQSFGSFPELLYLKAIYLEKNSAPNEDIMRILLRSLKDHFSSINNSTDNANIFFNLKSNLVVDILIKYFSFLPKQQPIKEKAGIFSINEIKAYLSTIQSYLPSHPNIVYMSAYLSYLLGDRKSSLKCLEESLKQTPIPPKICFLASQIYLVEKDVVRASQILDNGLSQDFKLKEYASYHMIRSGIFKINNNYNEALQCLKNALTEINNKKKKSEEAMFGFDNLSLHLEMADLYRLLKKTEEADETIEKALKEFKGQEEEALIELYKGDILLEKGKTDDALKSLNSIKPNHPSFIKAQIKIADIFLKYKKDKKLFIETYKKLYESNPTPHVASLYGDALMRIQQPQKAIEIIEKAIKKNPRDSHLANKIGQALVKTHQYGKAIIYYEAALKQKDHPSLRLELVNLLIKLQQEDKAEKILTLYLNNHSNGLDVECLEHSIECVLLMIDVCDNKKKYQQKLQYCDMANNFIERLQKSNVTFNPTVAFKCYVDLGDKLLSVNDIDKVDYYFTLAIEINKDDPELLGKLMKVKMIKEDGEAVIKMINFLLGENIQDTKLKLVMVDVLLRLDKEERALEILDQVASFKDDYSSFSHVLELGKRAGKLEKYGEILKKSNESCKFDLGFNYCMGLYQWYRNNTIEALQHLSVAKGDIQFGQMARKVMTYICMNPENKVIGGKLFEKNEASADKSKTLFLGLKVAEKLLEENKFTRENLETKLESCRLMIISGNPQYLHTAMTSLEKIYKTNEWSVSVNYLRGLGLVFSNKEERAESILRQTSVSVTFKDCYFLEQARLLLADLLIQKDAIREAEEILLKCLQFNKSCFRAQEMMGYIKESRQENLSATKYYEDAWVFSCKTLSTIGYKLAHNYLKTKKYSLAISISNEVLKSHPSYPKIKTEILAKSQLLIKTDV